MASPVTKPTGADAFVESIAEAVQLGSPEKICASVKEALKAVAAEGATWIPDEHLVGSSTGYARRIIHTAPDKSYSILLMVWRPGQGTAIHDHAGKWCVECVVRGEIKVVSFDHLGGNGDLHQFREASSINTHVGDVGVLIPPNEYHRLENAGNKTAATIHVYEGEMLWCHTFHPTDTPGTFRRERATLTTEE